MTHHDSVLAAFRQHQLENGMALDAASDRVHLTPVRYGAEVCAFLADFHCKGLVERDGVITEYQNFLVGINFDDNYLHRFDTARVLTVCHPMAIFHPNIKPPFICAGSMQPGTPLVDLLYQVYEIITYQNVEMRESHALNPAACAWARRNQAHFPIDRRPLRRRRCQGEG